MPRISECIKDIDTFEKVLDNLEYRGLYNLFIDNNKSYYKYDLLSDDFYTILLDYNFFNENKEQIDNIRVKNAEKRMNKILEEIKNSDKKITLNIDKYLNDEKFIREVINLANDRSVTLLFHNVVPSYNLKFLFQKEKVCVDLFNSKNENIELSRDWLTKRNFNLWEKDDSFGQISYEQLLNSYDSFEELSNLSNIVISNVTDSIMVKVNTSRKNILESKMEINSIYLKKVFDFVSKFRKNGYTSNITVKCDSLYDISCSHFNYESYGVNFTDSGFDMDDVNNFIYVFKRDIGNIDSNLSISEKLHYIFNYLYKERKYHANGSDQLRNFFISNQIFEFAYDLSKFAGLKPIKVPGEVMYYFFEPHSDKIVKFFPNILANIYDQADLDSSEMHSNIEQSLWNIAFNDINNEEDTLNSYSKYLVCNSVDEIVDTFKNSINTSDDLYFRDVDRYIDELKYIESILMDLSEEDYIEYKKYKKSINTIDDVLELVRYSSDLIVKNKKEQIGIVMHQNISNK